MLRPDSAKARTRKAYIAWAVAGYVKGYGLAAADALACAEIDWSLRLEAQSYVPPKVGVPGEMDMRKRLVRACPGAARQAGNAQGAWRESRAPPKAKPAPKHKVRDFRGVEFDSFPEMCRRWRKNRSNVDGRLGRGWSLERALTEPARPIGHL